MCTLKQDSGTYCRFEVLPTERSTSNNLKSEGLDQLVDVFCNPSMEVDIRRASLEQLAFRFHHPSASELCTRFEDLLFALIEAVSPVSCLPAASHKRNVQAAVAPAARVAVPFSEHESSNGMAVWALICYKSEYIHQSLSHVVLLCRWCINCTISMEQCSPYSRHPALD